MSWMAGSDDEQTPEGFVSAEWIMANVAPWPMKNIAVIGRSRMLWEIDVEGVALPAPYIGAMSFSEDVPFAMLWRSERERVPYAYVRAKFFQSKQGIGPLFYDFRGRLLEIVLESELAFLGDVGESRRFSAPLRVGRHEVWAKWYVADQITIAAAGIPKRGGSYLAAVVVGAGTNLRITLRPADVAAVVKRTFGPA